MDAHPSIFFQKCQSEVFHYEVFDYVTLFDSSSMQKSLLLIDPLTKDDAYEEKTRIA